MVSFCNRIFFILTKYLAVCLCLFWRYQPTNETSKQARQGKQARRNQKNGPTPTYARKRLQHPSTTHTATATTATATHEPTTVCLSLPDPHSHTSIVHPPVRDQLHSLLLSDLLAGWPAALLPCCCFSSRLFPLSKHGHQHPPTHTPSTPRPTQTTATVPYIPRQQQLFAVVKFTASFL